MSEFLADANSQIAEEAGVTVCYGSDLLISMHALQTGTSTPATQH